MMATTAGPCPNQVRTYPKNRGTPETRFPLSIRDPAPQTPPCIIMTNVEQDEAMKHRRPGGHLRAEPHRQLPQHTCFFHRLVDQQRPGCQGGETRRPAGSAMGCHDEPRSEDPDRRTNKAPRRELAAPGNAPRRHRPEEHDLARHGLKSRGDKRPDPIDFTACATAPRHLCSGASRAWVWTGSTSSSRRSRTLGQSFDRCFAMSPHGCGGDVE